MPPRLRSTPSYTSSYADDPTPTSTPRITSRREPSIPRSARSTTSSSVTIGKNVRQVTLTSKKNWWMVELDDSDDERSEAAAPAPEETLIYNQPPSYQSQPTVVHESPPIYKPSRHPTAIFSFPTPTSYSAPPNPTANLSPIAHGSTSELFKCVVKKPDVVEMELNGEMHSNATDVTTQFLAELRVYTTLARHRNIAAFLGCLEGVGMVLEYIEGRTLADVVRARPELSSRDKVDYHNQLLDGLTHLHSYGLSHGDLSLTNVYVTEPARTVKLLDFGRSVSSDSLLIAPEDEPADPFAYINRSDSQKKASPTPRMIEQIHPGTRPFSAPEILRGECHDAILADAYSFGMILVCLELCTLVDVKPWDQRKELLPAGFTNGCTLFQPRIDQYLRRWDSRKRLEKLDGMPLPSI